MFMTISFERYFHLKYFLIYINAYTFTIEIFDRLKWNFQMTLILKICFEIRFFPVGVGNDGDKQQRKKTRSTKKEGAE